MYILPVTPVSFRKLSFKSTVLFLGNLAFNKDTTDTQKKIKKAASILDVCVNYSRSAGNETQKFLWGGKKGCTHKKKKVSVKLLELNVFQHAESGGVQAEGVACVKMWAAVWKRTSLLQNVLEETGAVSGRVSVSSDWEALQELGGKLTLGRALFNCFYFTWVSPHKQGSITPDFYPDESDKIHGCQSEQGLCYLLLLVPSWNTVHFLLPWTLWPKASGSYLACNQESLYSLSLKYLVNQQGL